MDLDGFIFENKTNQNIKEKKSRELQDFFFFPLLILIYHFKYESIETYEPRVVMACLRYVFFQKMIKMSTDSAKRRLIMFP